MLGIKKEKNSKTLQLLKILLLKMILNPRFQNLISTMKVKLIQMTYSIDHNEIDNEIKIEEGDINKSINTYFD